MANSIVKMGGNAVFTYRQSVDHISGGIELTRSKPRHLVVRAYGTVVRLSESFASKQYEVCQIPRPIT